MLSPVEHFPVLVVAISLLSAFTILVAGWLNKKSVLSFPSQPFSFNSSCLFLS